MHEHRNNERNTGPVLWHKAREGDLNNPEPLELVLSHSQHEEPENAVPNPETASSTRYSVSNVLDSSTTNL